MQTKRVTMKLFTSFHENQNLLIIENEHVLSNNNYTQFNNKKVFAFWTDHASNQLPGRKASNVANNTIIIVINFFYGINTF